MWILLVLPLLVLPLLLFPLFVCCFLSFFKELFLQFRFQLLLPFFFFCCCFLFRFSLVLFAIVTCKILNSILFLELLFSYWRDAKDMTFSETAVYYSFSKQPSYNLQAFWIMWGLAMFKVIDAAWAPATTIHVETNWFYLFIYHSILIDLNILNGDSGLFVP